MNNLIIRKRIYCPLVAFLFLLAVGGSSLHAANDSPEDRLESRIGKKAPDFTFRNTKSGKSVSLSDLKYRTVVLCFSSTSTEGRKINADMAKVEEKYKKADVAFVNIPFEQYKDVAAEYGITSAPAICIINLKGEIRSIDYADVDLAKELSDIFGKLSDSLSLDK